MLHNGRLVINVAHTITPFKIIFLGLLRAIAWTFAFTLVGAALMRTLGGFGYTRKPVKYGASDENYRYSSMAVRETPRWAARLLGWTDTKLVWYYSDKYNGWYHSNGQNARKPKQLQRLYDMWVTRRELYKASGFYFTVGKGEYPVRQDKPKQSTPQAAPQVYAQNPYSQLPKIMINYKP